MTAETVSGQAFDTAADAVERCSAAEEYSAVGDFDSAVNCWAHFADFLQLHSDGCSA